MPLYPRDAPLCPEVRRQLEDGRTLALFLDYDGTLAPIRKSPERARLPRRTLRLLNVIAKRPDISLTIVTGRPMGEIRRFIRVKNVRFAANHGFHVRVNGSEWIHRGAISAQNRLARIREQLRSVADGFPGAFVEDKRFTLSLHYRNVSRGKAPALLAAARGAIRLRNRRLRTTYGKKVLEVRPSVDWGKGRAVKKILRGIRSPSVLPVYIGDDETDEDAFRILRPGGITVRVGTGGPTAARYCVRNTAEVVRFLREIVSGKSRAGG